LEAKLSLDEVTHGVIWQGAPPEMNKEAVAAAVPELMATMTTVPSDEFL
jgi:hypothetical protein